MLAGQQVLVSTANQNHLQDVIFVMSTCPQMPDDSCLSYIYYAIAVQMREILDQL